jgi:isopentenyl-diphosphate delta-isomerase
MMLRCCICLWLALASALVLFHSSHQRYATPFLSHRPQSTWNGAALSQENLLHADKCILVDPDDQIIGHDSKYQVHLFTKDNPRGKLHRAFSIFLFNAYGKLLLHQRAACKVTFPSVWTNACCSHPLYGCSPSEEDFPEDIASGAIPGIRAAAIRKLEHELGIQPKDINSNSFKFVTRVYYLAKDAENKVNADGDTWGEHEIDYILFVQGDFLLSPNNKEVSNVKYVSQIELGEMMNDSKVKWSPWFQAIAERFLSTWWTNLDRVLTTNDFDDRQNIHALN